MKKKLKYNALILCSIATLAIVTPAQAESYIQPYSNYIDYYELGMNALQKREYSVAIENLKKALAKDPSNSSIRNNIAVALTSRGTYYYNQGTNYESAANDYRSALYYLQYFGKYENSETIKQNITLAQQNLNSVLAEQKAKTDPLSRLKKAKELRGKGEFTASIVEYAKAAEDRQYTYESYVAIGDIMKVISNEYSAALYYDKALAIKSSDPSLHLKFGATLYNLGNIDAAVRELDIASENEKTKSDALNLLENIWKRKIAQNDNDPIAQMNLGAVYQKKGSYTYAMNQYKRAQSLAPNNQMIKLNMGTLLQQQGQYTEALNIYNSILKNRPNDIIINSYKAATLDKMGKKEEAILLYRKLLSQNPNNNSLKVALIDTIQTSTNIVALTYLEELSKEMPFDPEIQYAYAFNLHKNRRYSEALQYYEKSLQLNNKNLDAYLNIATIHKQQNNLEKAISTLNAAKATYPNNKKIAETLAEFKTAEAFTIIEKASKLYEEKNYNEAIVAYKSIPNPTEDVFLGIGACYQALEQYDNAIVYYNKALSLDSSNPMANYFLGLAYLYKKDYEKADISLKKALELDNVNPDIIDAYKTLKFARSEAEMNKGITLLENNKNKEAIELFNQAISYCTNNGYAYYYRGLAYSGLNEHEKSITNFKKALELAPEIVIVEYSIAISYEALNNLGEAKKWYQKFVTEYKNNDEYLQYAQKRLTEI